MTEPISFLIRMEIIKITKGQHGWWYVQFEGSHEALCLGSDKPGFEEGETVDVIIRKQT